MNVAPFMPQEGDRLPNFRHEVRNRPHPNKAFLYWKQPRNDMTAFTANNKPVVCTNDISETFYQDYSRRGIPSGQKYGDRDETQSVQVNPWRKPIINYYDGAALDPLRTTSRISNISRLERPVSKAQYKQPLLKTIDETKDLTWKSTPIWSSNMIDTDTVRNQSRQMRSRLSIRPESVQPISRVPREISDFTTWLQRSEPTQRVQFLNYLRSLTTVLEENEIETYLNPPPVNKATHLPNKRQPNISYQSQVRINNQKNTRKGRDFNETLDGEGIEIQKLFP
ncbi:hypothetical protein LOD99_64 [Oopsacas minuta]|uniref:Uncharacterized protein n=1 Tax=Oopsacas minuta TaxID=111878 RepID=A0AAV7K8H1_9METZ|nr:hypothetical protein LOD99_64 [Oopsacas minuta]